MTCISTSTQNENQMVLFIHRKGRRFRRCCNCPTASIAVVVSWFVIFIMIMNGNFFIVSNASNRRSASSTATTRRNMYDDTNQKYDRSVTTFDPQGHLLQVKYAQYAATQRTKRTIIAMIDTIQNAIYIATSTTTTQTSEHDQPSLLVQQQQPHQFIYRITQNIYFIGIGVMGDIRAVASHLRVQAQQHIYHYQEDMTVYQMAKIICQLQHQCTYQSGVRPLGMSCLIFGIDDQNRGRGDDETGLHRTTQTSTTRSNTWKMYKCTPGGSTPEVCNHDFGGTVLGYKEDIVLQQLFDDDDDDDDVEQMSNTSNPRFENDTIFTTKISNFTATTTNSSSAEADHTERFISLIQSAFGKIDDNDRETSRMMDAYVFRGSKGTGAHSHHRHPSPVTCFANIDCRSNNNNKYNKTFHHSLMRVRQYYNKE